MNPKRIAFLAIAAWLSMAAVTATAAEPASAKPEPVPVDGMLCVTATGELDTPFVRNDLEPVNHGGGAPPCPDVFSNCADVPGRSCTLQNCVTETLHFSQCRKQPGGIIIGCSDGSHLRQTTCDCLEQFHQICCDDNSCGFTCGTCTGGSSSLSCP